MPIFSCAVHHSMFFPWFSYMFLFANTFFDSFKLKESVDFATDKFWVTYWHAVKVVFVVNLLGFAFVPAPYQGLLQTFSMLCVHTAQQRNWTEEDPVEPEDELNEYEFEKILNGGEYENVLYDYEYESEPVRTEDDSRQVIDEIDFDPVSNEDFNDYLSNEDLE